MSEDARATTKRPPGHPYSLHQTLQAWVEFSFGIPVTCKVIGFHPNGTDMRVRCHHPLGILPWTQWLHPDRVLPPPCPNCKGSGVGGLKNIYCPACNGLGFERTNG